MSGEAGGTTRGGMRSRPVLHDVPGDKASKAASEDSWKAGQPCKPYSEELGEGVRGRIAAITDLGFNH